MMRSKVKQPDGLIHVLLNRNADLGDRDDAAMDLAAFDQPEVQHVLAQIALDMTTDATLAESCAESLAEIWCRNDNLDLRVHKRISSPSLRF
jgi:hypothetical protein